MHVQGAPLRMFSLFICFFSDRLVKLLICTVSLNEEQREEVERTLTVAVQRYLKFNSNPTIEAFVEHLIRVYQVSLVAVGSGSIIFTVECPTLDSLEHLWGDYLSGELDKVAERCFVTEDMRKRLNLDRIGLKTIIEEEKYWNCLKALREISSTYLGKCKRKVWEVVGVLHQNTVKIKTCIHAYKPHI